MIECEHYCANTIPSYFENLSRIASPTYVPTEQDELRVRVRTTGASETMFVNQPTNANQSTYLSTHHNVSFNVIDVGGVRHERRKWIHTFEAVNGLLFVADISDYDLKLYEDNKTNRMQEALTLFGVLCDTDWFSSTTFFLLFNKVDVFEEKIKRVPLTVCFPEYIDNGMSAIKVSTCVFLWVWVCVVVYTIFTQNEGSGEAAKEYIEDKFLEQNKVKSRIIYTYFACAVNTNSIVSVFNNIQDVMLSSID